MQLLYQVKKHKQACESYTGKKWGRNRQVKSKLEITGYRNYLIKLKVWVSTGHGCRKLSEGNCCCPFLTWEASPSAGSASFQQLLFLLSESQNDFQSLHSFWHKGYRRLFRLLIRLEPLKLHSPVQHGMAAAKKTIPWRGKQPACALM